MTRDTDVPPLRESASCARSKLSDLNNAETASDSAQCAVTSLSESKTSDLEARMDRLAVDVATLAARFERSSRSQVRDGANKNQSSATEETDMTDVDSSVRLHIRDRITGELFLVNHYGLLPDLKGRRLINPQNNVSGIVKSVSQLAISTVNLSTKFARILSEFPEVTGLEQATPNCSSDVRHHIITTDPPVAERLRRLRICGDYRRLNAIIMPDKFPGTPLVHLHDCSFNLRGKVIFSKLDLHQAYNQIPVAPEDIPKTTVVTPFRLYDIRVDISQRARSPLTHSVTCKLTLDKVQAIREFARRNTIVELCRFLGLVNFRAKLSKFFIFLNNQHPNIHFTIDIEEDGKLLFLDVLISKKAGGTLGHQHAYFTQNYFLTCEDYYHEAADYMGANEVREPRPAAHDISGLDNSFHINNNFTIAWNILVSWELKLGDIVDYPRYRKLDQFLAFEMIAPATKKSQTTSKRKTLVLHTASTVFRSCPLCKANHLLYLQTPSQHFKFIKNQKRCMNCFNMKHTIKRPVYTTTAFILRSLTKYLPNRVDIVYHWKNVAGLELADRMAKNSPTKIVKPKQTYYIPHHAVLLDSSPTIRLRVVFNASCRTSNETSLNDHMLISPLATILLQWQYHYVFTTDIAKMYRQILVDSRDTDYQHCVQILAPQTRNQLIELLKKGGFRFQKWASNAISLLADLDPSHISFKVLRILWNLFSMPCDRHHPSDYHQRLPCSSSRVLTEPYLRYPSIFLLNNAQSLRYVHCMLHQLEISRRVILCDQNCYKLLLTCTVFSIDSDIKKIRKLMSRFCSPKKFRTPYDSKHCSQTYFLAGSQLTLASLRHEFWILRAHDNVRSVLYKCVPCTRERADLPVARVNHTAGAFVHIGVDYVERLPVKGINRKRGFSTLLCQIEACLNSLPIDPLTDDPDDLASLTPGHFLIGGEITATPEPTLLHTNSNRLTRWQLYQQILESFWRRWNSDYVTSLQQRSKWRSRNEGICVGQLVLLRNDTTPPTKWQLGRITACHPGKDGLTRVVSVRTATTTFIRPLSKLAQLPIVYEDV
ncbi:YI31B protein, partial [Pseudoatta argentina]